jgi:hypothetical protein
VASHVVTFRPPADAARSHPTLRKEGVGRTHLDYMPSFLASFMRRGIV